MNGLRKGGGGVDPGPRLDHVLELRGVSYKGHAEPMSCLQSITSAIESTHILKDITMEVHAGEVMAVLGSRDSGKRTLLEVIARRAPGKTVGDIRLNNVAMSRRLFREQCGYVAKRTDLLPSLTVRQTVHYAALLSIGHTVNFSVKKGRIRKVLGDLALNQVANHEVSRLTASEHRRLAIATELVRDPVLVVLDNPTAGLDPLNTYFVVSILANHVRQYHRIALLTLDHPRSDIFPFLHRVTFLCLGEVVYSGSTRMMLDYFRAIHFPCPDLENPLMYYLCLSTVDRRTRDRFLQSSGQISELVNTYKLEGEKYRKATALSEEDDLGVADDKHAFPLTSFGTPSCLTVFFSLLRRNYCTLLNCNKQSLRELFLRLILLPLFFAFLLLFYFRVDYYQHSFLTRNGLILNCLVGVSFLSAAITALTFGAHRTRYYQESRSGKYGGPLFILNQLLFSSLISLLSVWAAASIIYVGAQLRPEWDRWAMFCAVLWTIYVFAEQQTMAIMLFVKSSYTTFVTSIYILIIYIVMASGTVRSVIALPQWLNFLSYGVVYRYAGAFLAENEFAGNPNLVHVPSFNITSGGPAACPSNNVPGRCVFLDGDHYLRQKYSDVDLNLWLNWTLCFVFVLGMWMVNMVVYLVPLPAFIKIKFRD